jgi:hypothetical protein
MGSATATTIPLVLWVAQREYWEPREPAPMISIRTGEGEVLVEGRGSSLTDAELVGGVSA